MIPRDTSVEAMEIQTDIFRRMSPGQRLQLGIDLTQTCRKILASGVRLRHPEYTAEQVHLAVIRLQLGDELFEKVYPEFKHLRP